MSTVELSPKASFSEPERASLAISAVMQRKLPDVAAEPSPEMEYVPEGKQSHCRAPRSEGPDRIKNCPEKDRENLYFLARASLIGSCHLSISNAKQSRVSSPSRPRQDLSFAKRIFHTSLGRIHTMPSRAEKTADERGGYCAIPRQK